jgi:Carboxypeptidase regulatory-like domain
LGTGLGQPYSHGTPWPGRRCHLRYGRGFRWLRHHQGKRLATRADTGISQQTVTNLAGMFIFSNLVVGEYNMTPKADGLAPISVPGVTLDLSQQRDLSFALNVAGSTQTTIVTAAEPLMNTTDG